MESNVQIVLTINEVWALLIFIVSAVGSILFIFFNKYLAITLKIETNENDIEQIKSDINSIQMKNLEFIQEINKSQRELKSEIISLIKENNNINIKEHNQLATLIKDVTNTLSLIQGQINKCDKDISSHIAFHKGGERK